MAIDITINLVNLQTTSQGIDGVLLTWTNDTDGCLTYAGQDVVQVWRAATNDRSQASKLAEVEGNSYTDTGFTVRQTFYYWVRAKNTSGELGPWEPSGSTSGVAGTPTTQDADGVRGDLNVEDGADVTGNNTSNDVNVGGNRAVAESGADQTGNNTAANISGQGNLATLNDADTDDIVANAITENANVSGISFSNITSQTTVASITLSPSEAADGIILVTMLWSMNFKSSIANDKQGFAFYWIENNGINVSGTFGRTMSKIAGDDSRMTDPVAISISLSAGSNNIDLIVDLNTNELNNLLVDTGQLSGYIVKR